jgi:ABC-type Fe3+-siderophore transport system permease subunit
VIAGILVVGAIVIAGAALALMLRRKGASWSTMAWRVMQAGEVAFVLAVLLYEKPQSFYTNFVIMPSLLLYLGGVLTVLVTIVLGTLALINREEKRQPLIAMAASALTAVVSILMIIYRAR